MSVNGTHSAQATPMLPALSPSQMVEAMSYLLETDQDFVNKLHQAYLRSVNSKFNQPTNNSHFT